MESINKINQTSKNYKSHIISTTFLSITEVSSLPDTCTSV